LVYFFRFFITLSESFGIKLNLGVLRTATAGSQLASEFLVPIGRELNESAMCEQALAVTKTDGTFG